MGNCLSKDQIKDGDEVRSTRVTTKPHNSTTEAVPQVVPSPIPPASERNPANQVTLDGSIYFFETVRQLSEATELLGPLKAVCGVLVKALETTRAVHANKDAWGELVDKIMKMQKTIEEQVRDVEKDGKQLRNPLNTDPAAVEALKDFTTSLAEVFEASSEALSQSNKGSNTLKRVLTVRIDGERIQEYTRAVDNCSHMYMLAIAAFTPRYIQEQADIAAIRALKIADNSGGNQHQTCTDKTRIQILQDIHTWAEDNTTTNQVFWLADRAGTGKSTVAKQITKDWEKAAKPVASFFFSINSVDTRSNNKFCPTIAAKLAKLRDFGSFRSTLTEALKQNPTVGTCDFGDQFEEILCAPLKETNKPVLIVLDALDECEKRDRCQLLSALLSKLDSLPMVKVLITSRPEPDLVKLLQKKQLVRSSDLRGSGGVDSSIQDVLQYVSHFFANSDELQSVQSYAPNLAKAANGLFIYARTACQYLEESPDLEAALEAIDSMNGLDDLYSQIMERAIPKKDTVALRAVSSILQAILAAQRPLSISEMQTLLKKDKVVQSVVERLASVLSNSTGDKPVEILHPTFQEYLTDKDRSGGYFIEVKQGHKVLAIGCLEICSAGAAKSAKEDPEPIPSALGYSALYWLNHAAAFLQASNAQDDIQSVGGRIISLFEKHLIQWFELIVLLKAVYQCTKNLATLETSGAIVPVTATGSTSRMHDCVRWCRDAQRFLQHHQPVIEQGYIHVRGALAFTPKESLIYKMYFATFSQEIPAVMSGTPVDWPSHRTLSGHTALVNYAAFSSDGTRVVSCSDDSTLRLWDGVTGVSIGGPMNGHTGKVKSVAFSPDGTRVVSCSYDCILRLWDGVTGASIGGPMDGHTGEVYSVAFSSDGIRIVSGSEDSTLRFWDGVTGASIGGPMDGHTGEVYSVAFSSDGIRIVSGSEDSTLRFWDGVTGASIGGPMNGHTSMIRSVSFSPDGTRVVSGSFDHTLRLWDSVTGASIGRPMNDHTSWVRSVAFSPDGTRVVSCSNDRTLRMWDGVTGASIGGPMNGHTRGVCSVSFSPDGTRVVSCSWDRTLRLWDGVTGASIGGPMNGHTREVNSVAFSPDGTRIVSCSSDHTLRLWDGVTGTSIGGPMNGHASMVQSVSFSPDGTRVVSCSWDRTLRLWDGVTGVSIGGPMNGHTKEVRSVSFSPDGARVVSCSFDRTLRLWDSVTGASIGGPMNGHASWVQSVAFSPDGTRVVSCSYDCILRLWDGVTGASIGGPMDGHTGEVYSVAFSSDGIRIVSGSEDSTLRLWDGVTGASIGGPMNGHTAGVSRVAFSPDGARVVSCSADETLRLWDSVTGASIGCPMNGHTSLVQSVAFSPDGTRVVSGSEGSTLRLWDGVTGASISGPMNGHTQEVNGVAFSPDGTRVVSCSLDKTIRLWDVSSCSEVAIIFADSEVYDVKFSACGSYVILHGHIWDIRLLPPSLVRGASPALFTPSSSPVYYDKKARMIKVHHPPMFSFPVSGCQVREWKAHGGRIALGLDDGRVLIIDCTRLL